MTTKVYFIRHCESDHSVHDDWTRPLTDKGLSDRRLVETYLSGKSISAVLSSPYKRAVQTVQSFAEARNMEIITIEGFRERRIDSGWIEDFMAFSARQWADFTYKLDDGECLSQVQARNIAALEDVLCAYRGANVAIGTHGTALCTIINHYDPSFGYEGFAGIMKLMPWAVALTFEGDTCISIEKTDLFARVEGGEERTGAGG